MNQFEITDPERMRLILETFSCLDNIRWSTIANYNLINYFRDDLTPDEKLLTHWLCYITDRQTAFLRIWEVGGYVLSHLVRSYTQEDERSVRTVLEPYVKRDGQKMRLECSLEAKNARLANYGITGARVPFASRYMPDDLVRIYRTLAILDSTSGRSLSTFIGATLRDEDDHRQNIRRMAAGLNELTYPAGGGSFSVEHFDAALDNMDEDAAVFVPEVNTRQKLFRRKRLWCSVRDFLKSPEFNDAFISGLRNAGVGNVERWKRTNPALKKALDSLELPGDVWNNAKVFREGLFTPYLRNERSSRMPETIRKTYDLMAEEWEMDFYPEQLDVTFDFVPRMCEKKMCSVCLFGNGVEELCHQQPDYLCPVVLVSCGYKYKCSPDSCGLRRNLVKGFCRSSVEKQ